MKSQIKTLSIVAFVAVMFAGCVSEQERQARAVAEKARQEQALAEEKARQEQALAEEKARQEQALAEEKARQEQALAEEKARQEQMAREAKEQEEKARLQRIEDVAKSFDVKYLAGQVALTNDNQMSNAALKRLISLPATILPMISLPDVNIQVKTNAEHVKICDEWKMYHDMLMKGISEGTIDVESLLLPDVSVEVDKTMTGESYKSAMKNNRLKIYASQALVNDAAEIEKEILSVQLSYIANRPRLNRVATALVNISKNGQPEARAVAEKRLIEIATNDIASVSNKNCLNWLAEIAKSDTHPEIRGAATKRLSEVREKEYLATANRDCENMIKGLAAIQEIKKGRGYDRGALFDDVTLIGNSTHCRDRLRKAFRFDAARQKIQEAKTPLLHFWSNVICSRRGKKEEDCLRGDALLEKFGTSFMPNAFSRLEKTHERVSEIQQMFNEEFPTPYNMLPSDPKWTAFEKILTGLMKAKVKFFRYKDELCHFYLMHKVGALTAEELGEIDSEQMPVKLLDEMPCSMDFSAPQDAGLKLNPLKEDTCAFAAKSMPETYSIYQKCILELDGTQKLLGEIIGEMQLMDIVRFDLCVIGCREKLDFITKAVNCLSANITGWHTEYKIMEKSASDIAKLDHDTAMRWKGFAELLPNYITDRANGTIVACNSKMSDYYPCNLLSKYIASAIGLRLDESESRIRKDGYVKAYVLLHPTSQSQSWGDAPRRAKKSSGDYILEINEFGREIINLLNSYDSGGAVYSIVVPEYKENWYDEAVEIRIKNQ